MEVLTVQTDIKVRLGRISQLVGNTPLADISVLSPNPDVRILAKVEWQQFSNSVKARAAFNIIKHAVENGEIHSGRGLIDASSGNTAVAYAAVGAALGIPITICLPENASSQKKIALHALGATTVLTSKFGTTDEAQQKAKELATNHPKKYWYADQYANEDNWKAHYYGTAQEILYQTNASITHFVAGLGTTGTFMGIGRRLKAENPDIQLISLQPDVAMHGLEGWKHLESAKVPKIYDAELADDAYFIDTWEAYEVLKKTAKETGLLVSPSAAANVAGAIKLANKIAKGTIVTILTDHGSNYPEILNEIFN